MKQVTAASLSAGSVVQRADHLLSAAVGRDIVLLDAATSAYYDTDSIGAEIWTLLEQPTTVRSLVATLITRYDVAPAVCERDVLCFLEDARAEGLIRTTVAPGA